MRVGLLTGGGDAPGLNAVIRAVVKSAATHGVEIVGIEDGFVGLVEPGRWRPLTLTDLPGILRQGGTILGTTNRQNPFAYPAPTGVVDCSERCMKTFHDLGLAALVVIGGDGTLAIAQGFHQRGLPLVAVPKTIDNDIVGTDRTFGFDTAVGFATEAIDRLHTTAESHHRVIVVEVMGRYAGWIALHAGVAGGADAIVIPEIPYRLDSLSRSIVARESAGARFSIVVAAEGARPVGGSVILQEAGSAATAERLGGVAARLTIDLKLATGKDARSVVLGHLQRGGGPSSSDRLLATCFGARAMEMVMKEQWGTMVALQGQELVSVPLDRVTGRIRTVPPDCDLIRTARLVGIGFGD